MTSAQGVGARRPLRLLGVGVVALVVAGCAPEFVALGPASSPHAHDLTVAPPIPQVPTTVGVADSDLYGRTAAGVDASIRLMKSAGLRSVRIMVPWAGIEREPGRYDWSVVDVMIDAAASEGISVLATLNSTPTWAVVPGQPPIAGRPASAVAFGRFAGSVAERYRGKVAAYEIWNEPNATAFFEPAPDPAGYVDLLRASYLAVKVADPSAVVVAGGLGPLVDRAGVAMDAVKFLEAMYAAGAKNYFDALGYHPYQYTMKFSEGGYHPDAPMNQIAALRQVMLANGDLRKRIWATEYGEPSSVAGEEAQSDYLDDMLQKWRSIPYAGPVYLYTLRDRNSLSTDFEDTLGMYRSDGSAKPSVEVVTSHAATSAVLGKLAAISAPR
ncbi:beta-galactosidase [Mycolicibacterium sp.]|uniref:beta-galactosidase n=1 Tax=Mycolicibacterium sp. TaxID=2320850 RepID=UPI001A21C938|nr:beta-galactosidase [Mycolicibacterium sp.]MBJ7339066.1 beta-galactosidase [Mycolicibacterium sp.]